jgi:hypothetical protein
LSDLSGSREQTIYHYKLIAKITLPPEAKYSYIVMALVGISLILIIYGFHGLLFVLLAFLMMLAVHAFVLHITLRRLDEPSQKRWSFRRDWPWIGPLPMMDTNLSLFRRLHFHLLLVGCCIVGLFYPWSASALLTALTYWHFWLLAPRFSVLWRMRKQNGDGIIRLDAKEVSYYHR